MPLKLPQILQHKSFRDLWLGQSISQLGDAFYFVTFMFMAEKLTGRIEMVGLVGALEAIPYLLFSAYAGVLADRIDRRRIMWLSDVASGIALILFGSVLLFDANPPAVLLLVMSFVTSTIRCFFLPAKSAAIPNLVPNDKVLEANAFSMTTQSLMPLIGLALSASVMAPLFAYSPRWFFLTCVILNALSFFGSAFYIGRLPAIVPERKGEDEVHPLEDFKLGWKYMTGRRDLLVLTGMLVVFRLFLSPFFVVHVAANKAWFGGKPSSLAWFEFSFFMGMILVSPFVGKMNIKRPTLTFAYGLGAVGLFVAFMAYSELFWLYVLWNFACGLVLPIADIPINAYMQMSVPDSYRGRVNSVFSMLGMGIMPIGMVMAGYLVDHFGLVATFLFMGIGMFLAALIGPMNRAFREARMPVVEPPSESKVIKLEPALEQTA